MPDRTAEPEWTDSLLQLYRDFIVQSLTAGDLVLGMVKDGSLVDRETFVSVAISPDGSTRVHAKRARGLTVLEQLGRLSSEGQPANLEELAPRLAIDTYEIDEAACPGLRGAVEMLRREPWTFDFTPQPADEQRLALHPRIFMIASASAYGSAFQWECRWPTPQCERLADAYNEIASCIPGAPAER